MTSAEGKTDMAGTPERLVLLDSWDRNNTILLNRLRALPWCVWMGKK